MPNTKKKIATNSNTTGQTFSEDEKAAMRERALELKANASREEGEKILLGKIAEMSEPDRSMAKRIHEIVTTHAPQLLPKTWYGMPAYANKDGKAVCFFQSADKFKARYATLGFNDVAHLDDGNLWPTSFALKKLTKTEEEKIVELVKRAVK